MTIYQHIWWCPVKEQWQGYKCGDSEHGDGYDAHEPDAEPDEAFVAVPASSDHSPEMLLAWLGLIRSTVVNRIPLGDPRDIVLARIATALGAERGG